MTRLLFCSILAGMLLITGCRTFNPDAQVPLPISIPDRYSGKIPGELPPQSWWETFNSNELNQIVSQAMDNNLNLRILRAKLDQAKASVDKASADFLPGLNFSLGGEKQGIRTETENRPSEYIGSHSWDASLSGSWTADLWGEIAAGEKAKIMDMAAAKENLEQAQSELAAQVCEIWIDIISVRNKKKILDNQIDINATLLELQKLRYVNGKADALDVSQQRESLAEVKSQYPLIEKQEKTLLSSLAFLSGKASVYSVGVDTGQFPEMVQVPGVGFPSQLLERRPDIRSAKRLLTSSQWQIEAAKADLLPSLTLSARALFSSGRLDLLFQNWVATLAASLSGPIFDGGVKAAEVKRLKALAEERVNRYAQTVAAAINEVEDLLVSINSQDDYIRLLKEELELARLTLKDAQVQYQNGQSTYLAYLIVWTRIEQLERQLVGEQATAFKERIKLYSALGFNGSEN